MNENLIAIMIAIPAISTVICFGGWMGSINKELDELRTKVAPKQITDGYSDGLGEEVTKWDRAKYIGRQVRENLKK